MAYRLFTRTWWKPNPSWPGGLEPEAGLRMPIHDDIVDTIEVARYRCQRWFAGRYGAGAPGRENYEATLSEHLGLKLEFEEC